MTNILPNAGIPAPIPDTFDFAAWLAVPATISSPGIPLRIRNRENIAIERHNDDSIYITIMCRDYRADHTDVGPRLKPLWGYTPSEFEEMVDSEGFATSVGPLPVCLCGHVERARTAKREEKDSRTVEKDKTKGKPVEGSMIMVNPILRIPGQQPPVVIPAVFLHSISNKLFIPINWFTNERLRIAQHHLSDLHVKLHRPEVTVDSPNPEKITVFDMVKMITLWGTDELPSSMTPLKWQQCSKNLLSALRLLSEKVSPDQLDKLTFAGEFEKHRNFFCSLGDYEETFVDWFTFERESRHDIFNSTAYDASYYARRVEGILDAKRAARSYTTSPVSPYKRAAEPDARPAKVARTSNESPSGTPSPFRTDGSAPSCLACGDSHRLYDHPAHSTTFIDGKPHFCSFRDKVLSTAKPFNGKDIKQVCIPYNLAGQRGCDGKHDKLSRLHICSFCGKDHAALSRHASCLRVEDGRIRA